jgi:hypothetical protein
MDVNGQLHDQTALFPVERLRYSLVGGSMGFRAGLEKNKFSFPLRKSNTSSPIVLPIA